MALILFQIPLYMSLMLVRFSQIVINLHKIQGLISYLFVLPTIHWFSLLSTGTNILTIQKY